MSVERTMIAAAMGRCSERLCWKSTKFAAAPVTRTVEPDGSAAGREQPGDRLQFLDIAGDPVAGPRDRARGLEHRQRRVDLGPARADEQREIGLRHAEVERHARLAAARLPGAREEEPRQPALDRIERDGLELLIGLAQPRAQEPRHRLAHRRTARRRALIGGLGQGHRHRARHRRRVGGSRAAVEHCDLAEPRPRSDLRERQLPPLPGQDRQPDAAVGHEQHLAALVAAREDQLARVELDLAHLRRHRRVILRGESGEQRRPGDEIAERCG